jgi:hypothetical protein
VLLVGIIIYYLSFTVGDEGEVGIEAFWFGAVAGVGVEMSSVDRRPFHHFESLILETACSFALEEPVILVCLVFVPCGLS